MYIFPLLTGVKQNKQLTLQGKVSLILNGNAVFQFRSSQVYTSGRAGAAFRQFS